MDNKTLQKENLIDLTTVRNIERILLESLDFEDVIGTVVSAILTKLGYMQLGYRIAVLTLINEKKGVLERISLSETSEAKKTLKASPKKFENIEIPLDFKDNASIKAINSGHMQIVTDFKYILCPELSIEEARQVQKAAGIKTSVVIPMKVRGEIIGTMIFSMIKEKEKITKNEKELLKYFTNLASLAVQNSKLYSTVEERTKQLVQVNKKLKELDKFKDELISIVSHELKTPVSIIKTNLWMLNYLNKSKGKKETHLIDEMNHGLERLSLMINNLLNVSRIQQGKIQLNIQKVDIDALVKKKAETMKPLFDKKKIKLILPEVKVGYIYADPIKTEEAVENYISNAYKYTDKGKVKIDLKKKKKTVLLSVTDTGPGIPKEDYTKIFTKFGRAGEGLKQHGEGASTGLGLYIVKYYIEMMGGKVGFVSDYGKGTSFWMALPRKQKKGE
ncbi:MAG: GAF domain-containing sensor histidine kinase [Bacteroidetes bacterium]|nr:GAF domain-containing sensor histidine kinase [Bacteroidota bacterium]